MPVMAIVNSDTNYAVVSDHLNTPRRMTGSDGSLVWQWGYSAFREEQPTAATRKFNKVATIDGDLEMDLRYPGQHFDKESGLPHKGFRTYNPAAPDRIANFHIWFSSFPLASRVHTLRNSIIR